MADLEIKVISAGAKESAAEIDKIVSSVNKLTAAEKELAKSAKASAEAMTAGIKARNNSADQATYLSNLTKEAKELGNVDAATQKAFSAKSKLLDGVKKLGKEIPGLGAALSALKNPYTLIAAAAGLAYDAVRRLAEDIDKMADASSKFETVGQAARAMAVSIQESAGQAAAFELAIRRIQTRAESATEQLARLQKQANRTFSIEEQLNGAGTPEQQRDRRQRRIAADINAVGNAQINAGNAVREARAALPGARDAAVAAQSRLGIFENLASQNEQFIGEFGGRQKLVDRIAELRQFAAEGNQSAKLQLQTAESALQRYDAARRTTEPRLQPLRNKAAAAQAEVSRLEGVITTGEGDLRNFGAQKAGLIGDLSADQAAFGKGNLGPNFDPRVQQAFEAYQQSLIKMFNSAQLRIDAISKTADDAARAARAAAFANAMNSQNSQ